MRTRLALPGAVSALLLASALITTTPSVAASGAGDRGLRAELTAETFSQGIPEELRAELVEDAGRRLQEQRDRAPLQAAAPLAELQAVLQRGRVLVTVDWRSQFTGAAGRAFAIPQEDRFAFFYFTDPNNPEVFVKVLDFGPASPLLVFYAGLSNFQYTVRFEQLCSGGATQTFVNPAGSLTAGADNTTLPYCSPLAAPLAVGGVASLNGLQGNVTLNAGSNIEISQFGNGLLISAAGGGGPGGFGVSSLNGATGAVSLTGSGAATVSTSGGTINVHVPTTSPGSVSSVTAGAGLFGGGTSGNVSLQVASGGIQTDMIANGAVTNDKLAGGIEYSKIVGGPPASGGGGGGVTSVSAGAGLTGGGTGSVTLGIAANGIQAGMIAGGQVVKSVNGLFDAVQITGPGVSTAGNTITISGSASPSGAAARYTTATAQALAEGAATKIDFATKDYDTNDAVKTGSNWRFVAPAAGIYNVSAHVKVVNAQTASATLQLQRNGTAFASMGGSSQGANLGIPVGGSTDVSLATGDTLALVVQFSGSTVPGALVADAAENWVSVHFVRP